MSQQGTTKIEVWTIDDSLKKFYYIQMEKKFRHSTILVVEDNLLTVEEELKKIGYYKDDSNVCLGCTNMEDNKVIITSSYGFYFTVPDKEVINFSSGPIHSLLSSLWDCGKNKELALSIAAIRSDSDKGQWFISESGDWFKSEKETEDAGRKAKITELIVRFNKNEN